MIINHSKQDQATFVTWLCWLLEIIIDFPQTLSLGHVGYG
jgi:hypothetical protein